MPHRIKSESVLITLDVEQAVRVRYSAASQAVEPALCCPVSYDARYLAALPAELLERDYGCGDPSPHVQEGDTVLDLGSGGGKICYIASQIVGPRGRVIGIDMNDDMLVLARRYQAEIGDRLGWHNVEFHKGRIQDLGLNLARLESELAANPIHNANDFLAAQRRADELRRTAPLIPQGTIDVVISNCVLNLVNPADRRQLFAEMFRVLKPGGRAAISDIVCDEPVPEHLKNDPRLWSGCLSGAFLELEFLEAFAAAGFYGMEIIKRDAEPWAVVEGLEFRSVTVRAYKPAGESNLDRHQAVIYKGPWAAVRDDFGRELRRGERTAVSEELFGRFTSQPYAHHLLPVEPAAPVPRDQAQPFDAHGNTLRSPRETKNTAAASRLPGGSCCGPAECC